MPKNEFTCDCMVVHEDTVRKAEEQMLSDKIYGNAERCELIYI